MEIIDRILRKNGNAVKGKYLVSSDKELPEHCKTEAMYWKAKYYELRQAHISATKGLKRLSRFKAKHRYVARACKEAYRHGVKDERYRAIKDVEATDPSTV